MQIITSIFLVLLNDLAFAQHQDFSPLARRINVALESIHENKFCIQNDKAINEIQIFEDYAPDSQFQLKEDCLKQVCPSIEENRNKSLTQNNPLSPKHTDLNSALEPVKEALKDLIDSELLLARDHLKWGEQMKKAPLQVTEKLGLAGLGALAKTSVEALTKRNFSTGSKTTPEDSRIYANGFAFLGPQDSEAMAKIVVRLSQDPRMAATGANFLGAPFRYKRQFPELNYQDAVRKDLEATKIALENAPPLVKEMIHLSSLDSELEDQISNISNGQMIDEIEGQNSIKLTDQIHRLLAVQKYATDSPGLGQRVMGKLIDLSKASIGKNDTSLLKALPVGIEKMSLIEVFKFFGNKSKSEELYQNCLYDFALSSITLPSKQDLEKFEKRIPAMRNKISQSLGGKYSQVSTEILNSMIKTVSVFLPPEKERYLAKVAKGLRSKTERNNSIRRIGNQSISDAAVVEVFTGSEKTTPALEIEDTCNKLAFHPVRDNTVAILGGIAVGADSVKDENFGLSVLAHEIGHNVQTMLQSDPRISEGSRAKQRNIEECVKNLHQPFFTKLAKFNEGKPNESKDPRISSHFLREDFSDLIATHVPAKGNFICELAPDGLAWGPTSGDLDTHSSLLFRVLHVEAASERKLPEKCQRFLTLNKYELKGCF